MNVLTRSSLRYLTHHPWQAVLSVLGVALGVAVVVGIDLANASAERAFELSAESVTGRATHQVVGAGEGLAEETYRRLRVELGFRQAAPVVEGYVRAGDRTLHLLGVDPLAEAPFRSYTTAEGELDLGAFMALPSSGIVSTGTAEALGVAPGDSLRLSVEGRPRAVRIVGVMQPQDENSRRALADLLVTDVATAQELLGMVGRLTRIDLILPEGPHGEALRARIKERTPEGAEVVRSTARTETVAQMSRAFEVNLTALSLLALVVGTFLIYNTMTFSVVQRRPLIGRLRALGVTRREVFRLILVEATLIGAVGTAFGLALGVLLGGGLVRLVTQTINDLYYVVNVRELAVTPLELAKGVVLGMGATVAAALQPAREATRAPASTVLQRSQQESRARGLAPRLAVAAAGMLALSAGLLAIPGTGLAVSYAGLLGILLAAALATPGAVVLLAGGLRPVMGRLFGVLGRMAARGLVATLSRTSVAVAALTIAVAATVGVGIMVGSFRDTVESWLGYSLQADVYVQPPNLVVRRGDASIAPAVARRLRETPGVAAASSVRSVTVGSEHGLVELAAIEPGPTRAASFRFTRGDPPAIWEAFTEGDVLVSEPFSYRFGTTAGDSLRLQTDRGPRRFRVAGVFYDYGSDQGVVMMPRRAYERWYDDRGISGLALYAADGQDVDALLTRLRGRVGGEQQLLLRSNRALREASLEIFDRSFRITTVLRLLAIVVAFVGVLSALMALQLERARELAVLRAEGMTPRQLWHYVTMQTGVMGLAAGLLALPLGVLLAFVLVYVINKRSFGWTLQFEVPPEVLAQAVAVAVLAAVLAGLYPSWRMARANPAEALREE